VARVDKYMRKFESQASDADIGKIASKLPKMKRGPVAKMWNTVESLWALVKDPNGGWGSKVLAIAALVYLISPIDAIPDIIPVLGLTDDAAVLAGTAARLATDLKRYMKK
jgi:uncharacterized membrane protein YkvA (DUF1232 family)